MHGCYTLQSVFLLLCCLPNRVKNQANPTIQQLTTLFIYTTFSEGMYDGMCLGKKAFFLLSAFRCLFFFLLNVVIFDCTLVFAICLKFCCFCLFYFNNSVVQLFSIFDCVQQTAKSLRNERRGPHQFSSTSL